MKYLLKKQEESYYCFSACLQAILYNFDIKLMQKDIAKQIKCSKKGVLNLNYIKIFLEKYKLNFSFYNWNETPFNEPDFLLSNERADILIARPHLKGYHLVLLEKFKDPNLSIIDPKDAKIYDLNLFDLIREMEKAQKSGFGLIEKIN